MAIGTYDPKKNLVTFANVPITGFAPDTFIKVERNTDSFTVHKGASGESARTQSNDRSGTITLTLMASASSNDALSALAALDELSAAGVAPFQVKELNGTMVVHAANAWIKKQPAVERAKELGNVEWVLETDDLSIFAGGLVVVQ